MTDILDNQWLLNIYEYVKDQNGEKKTILSVTSPDSPLRTKQDIYQKLEEVRITNLPFFTDVSLIRADLKQDDQHQTTRISIVNFPSEMSTQVFIDLIDSILNKTIVFDGNLENITFMRRMQNYTVYIELTGFDNITNPSNVAKVNEYLTKYRESPDDYQFSIEIYPMPRTLYQNGRKKLSAKNTADSVRNLLRKRQLTHH